MAVDLSIVIGIRGSLIFHGGTLYAPPLIGLKVVGGMIGTMKAAQDSRPTSFVKNHRSTLRLFVG